MFTHFPKFPNSEVHNGNYSESFGGNDYRVHFYFFELILTVSIFAVFLTYRNVFCINVNRNEENSPLQISLSFFGTSHFLSNYGCVLEDS